MILVDTSVWIDPLRRGDPVLQTSLDEDRVLAHILVLGELAMGSFRQRNRILNEIKTLHRALLIDHDEVLAFIEHHTLFGLGIGYIDCHLLASVGATPGASLWTRDKRLLRAALHIGLPVKSEPYLH